MPIRNLLLCCTCLCLLLPAFGQEGDDEDRITIGKFFVKKPGGEVFLRGKVTDPETGENEIGVSVGTEEFGLGTKTNDKGDYALLLPIGKHTIIVSKPGKETMSQKIEIFNDGVLDFGLNAQGYSLREVVIETTMDDENIQSASAGVSEIKIKEIRALPAFMGEVDVVQTLLLLPGVSTVGEGSSGYNVRGGRIDQNLVQLNGISLFNPSHVLGFFSAFNPDVIESFTLYKGAVPAQFGGRASSVLDVFIRNGDYQDYKFKGGLGLISSRFVAEGPIVKDKTSFLLGGRASYSDWILKLIKQPDVRQSAGSFYDLNAIVSHRINLNHQLSLSYYRSSDFFRFAQRFGYAYTNQMGSLQYKGILSDQLSATTLLGLGEYSSRSFEPQGPQAFNLDNGIDYLQFKQNFLFVPNRHTMNFGFEANFHRMKADELSPRGPISAVAPQVAEKDKSRDVALYFNDEFDLNEYITLNLGLRASAFQQVGAETLNLYQEGVQPSPRTVIGTEEYADGEVVKTYGGLEPRLSGRLKLGPASSIKLGYARIFQYMHLISNSSAPTPVDVWQVSTPYIKPQIGDNLSLGFYQNFNSNVWESYVEFYYKNIQNLIDYIDFPDLLLNPNIETDLVAGQGRAYGAEVYIRRKVGLVTGWLSYTYARSEIKLDSLADVSAINGGDWYPTSYDQPHSISMIFKRQVKKNSFFTLSYTYRTGRPFTGLLSNYEQNHSPVPHFSERNRYRIPDYHRLDVSLQLALTQRPSAKFDSDINISFYNILGRRNAFSVFYQKPPERVLIPVAFQLSVLGSAFPAVTYNVQF